MLRSSADARIKDEGSPHVSRHVLQERGAPTRPTRSSADAGASTFSEDLVDVERKRDSVTDFNSEIDVESELPSERYLDIDLEYSSSAFDSAFPNK